MCTSKPQNICYKDMFSLFASKSEVEIEEEIRKCDETKVKDLYLQTLIKIKEAISVDDIENLKQSDKVITVLHRIQNKRTLKSYYQSDENPISNTNLVILACKHNAIKVLEYIFSNKNKVLDHLSSDIEISVILSKNEDGECHNSFYFAIRSNNVKLLDTLIAEWPDNYFDSHLDELDEVLSKAYEEIRLRNIPLSYKMELFVENKIIDLRFFSKDPKDVDDVETSLNNVKDRVELILDNIEILTMEYSNAREVNQKFVLTAKFIAQNIHILKRQLRATYDRFPWEEMEFCLIAFVKSKVVYRELNLMCNFILTKKRILTHLENFALKLKEIKFTESDIGTVLPSAKRDDVIATIIYNFSVFEDLYNDYKSVSDIHSLERISSYIKLAENVNPEHKQDCFVIIRALQVIEECLKNTLESPNVSATINELLMFSVSKGARELLLNLQNYLSYSYSLLKKTKIEESNSKDTFDHFAEAQEYLEEINYTVSRILFNNEIKICRTILKSIINNVNSDEMKEMTEDLSFIKENSKIFQDIEDESMKYLVDDLSNAVDKKTDYENVLFSKIDNLIVSGKFEYDKCKKKFNILRSTLRHIRVLFNNSTVDGKIINIIKHISEEILEGICPKEKLQNLKEIAEIAVEIAELTIPRLHPDNANMVIGLTLQILHVIHINNDNIGWIVQLQEKLVKNKFVKCDSKTEHNARINNLTDVISQEKWNNELSMELLILEYTLVNNAVNSQLMENYLSYKSNTELQAAIEMLVQNVMSVLENSKKNLTNNMFFIDDTAPLLIGKSLHNHLAHDNALNNILFDTSIATVLNARKLVSEDVINDRKLIGKLVGDDPSRLKDKFYQDLQTVTNQEVMFIALEEGNIENVKRCIRKGADINARTANLWTALHFAAKGPNLEVVKFVFNPNLYTQDVDGHYPLHIASMYGRKSTVEFFVQKANIKIDSINNSCQTSLHLSCQNGHKDVVKLLLKSGAKVCHEDLLGSSPVHHAIFNNQVDVAIILLKKERNVDANKFTGGCSPLFLAAQFGCLRIVQFLIQNKANVNIENDDDLTPLHVAAKYGHFEVVQTLIFNGANVNAKTLIKGVTPLLYAVRSGNKNIVKILLNHGAKVNISDNTYNYTPLHYAAKDGYVDIIKILLEKKANVNAVSCTGFSPLHLELCTGFKETANVIVQFKEMIDSKWNYGCTALHLCSYSGHKDVVEILIKKGANIHSRDEIGRTPVHLAAICGSKEIVELLIAEKADIDSVDKHGCTALHLSCMYYCKDVAEILIKNGAKIDVVNEDSNTPLHIISGAASNNIIKKILLQKVLRNFAESEDCTSEKLAKVSQIEDSDSCIKRNLCSEIAKLLLDNGTNIRAKCEGDFTPLHLAALNGNDKLVEILVKGKAEVDIKTLSGHTPLNMAVYGNHRRVIEVLIQNGADVNVAANNGFSSLYIAILQNYVEVAELLVVNGADCLPFAKRWGYKNIAGTALKSKKVNNCKLHEKPVLEQIVKNEFVGKCKAFEANSVSIDTVTNALTPLYNEAHCSCNEVNEAPLAEDKRLNNRLTSLHFASYYNRKEIVELLLERGSDVNAANANNLTLLHLAALGNHKEIIEILLAKGADVNAKTSCSNKTLDNLTPLHIASKSGHKEIVKALLENKANVNCRSGNGFTPLHAAVVKGLYEVVEILMRNGANVDIKDDKNRTALQLATINGNLQIIKALLKCEDININVKGEDNWTALHIASQEGYLDIVKSLVDAGADVHTRNIFGSEPVHIAARKGHEAIVQFFLNNGCHIEDSDAFNGTLLHYAAGGGQLKVAKYLIEQNADINATDGNGASPLHCAAEYGFIDIIELLVNNGAMFNLIDKHNRKPSDLAKSESIINSLTSTEKLFKAVKCAKASDVKTYIKTGAFINAKNVDNSMSLHYAAWKGYKEVVDVLLRHQANPNVLAKSSFTPLHYAAKFGHFEIVKSLLSSGAIYNSLANKFKMPIDFAVKQNIVDLLKLVAGLFEKMQEGDPKVVDDLRQIKEIDIMKVLMNACNRENKTFMIAAVHSDFPKVEKLKQVLLDDVRFEIDMAKALHLEQKYQTALTIFQNVFEKKKKMLGPNNPVTLEIQIYIARVLYGQSNYPKVLSMLQETYEKQKKFLGENYRDTLNTQNFVALILYRQGQYQKALEIYQEVCQKQKEVLGMDDEDTLSSQFHMAAVLDALQRYEEALSINYEIFEKRKQTLGINSPFTLNVWNNIAMVLDNQGKHEEAVKIYKQVHEKRTKILGSTHSDTLNTLSNMVAVLVELKKYDEALEAYQGVFILQKQNLGANHLNTLNTQYFMANILYLQKRWLQAFEYYKNGFDRRKALLGPNHPAVLDTIVKLNIIESIFNYSGDDVSEPVNQVPNNIFDAANMGDIKTVQDLLDHGINVNIRDADGRTPLYFAANSNHKHVVRLLLKNKADATKATIKGITALHSATSKGNQEIVELLLEHMKQENRNKLHDFVNAQTTLSGLTSLHVAAKNGCLEIVKLLLKYGAIYNVIDKNNKKTPHKYSENWDVADLLNLVDQLFDCAEKGNDEIINQLNELHHDTLQSIANAHNKQGQTAIQIALINKHKGFASSLIKILQ